MGPPASHPFGERQYAAEDPAGYRWTFTQSVEDVPPESWGAQVAEIRSRVDVLPRPRLCYIEVPAADPHRSADFYERVFGWNIRRRHAHRPSFDDATGHVSGAFVAGRPASREAGFLLYIWVNDIDATLARAADNGAEIVQPTHPESENSWIATFRDPAGNIVGLYQEGSRNLPQTL